MAEEVPEKCLKGRSGPVLGVSGGKAVPDPRLADEIPRIGSVWLDLSTELRHQRPQVLRLLHGVGAPDRFENGAMGQYAVTVAHEQSEQIHLLGRQPDLVAASQHASTVVVDRDIARAQETGLAGLVREDATQRHPDPREQLLRAERLRDVIIGPKVQGIDLVRLSVTRGQDDERSWSVGARMTF